MLLECFTEGLREFFKGLHPGEQSIFLQWFRWFWFPVFRLCIPETILSCRHPPMHGVCHRHRLGRRHRC